MNNSRAVHENISKVRSRRPRELQALDEPCKPQLYPDHSVRSVTTTTTTFPDLNSLSPCDTTFVKNLTEAVREVLPVLKSIDENIDAASVADVAKRTAFGKILDEKIDIVSFDNDGLLGAVATKVAQEEGMDAKQLAELAIEARAHVLANPPGSSKGPGNSTTDDDKPDGESELGIPFSKGDEVDWQP